MQWFTACMRKYATFSGRARRAEYWWFVLTLALIQVSLYIIALILSFATGSTDPYTGQQSLGLGWLPMILLFLVGFGTFLPQLAVTVRRLHDTGKSGWYYFVSFIPFVGSFILLYFMVIDSQFGANQYGSNPKGLGGNGYGQPGGQFAQFGQAQPQQGQFGQPAYSQPQQGQFGQPQY